MNIWKIGSSFPSPAASAVTSNKVVIEETPACLFSKSRLSPKYIQMQQLCAGTAAAPDPNAGIVCIYPTYSLYVSNAFAKPVPSDGSRSGIAAMWLEHGATGLSSFETVWAYRGPLDTLAARDSVPSANSRH